MNTQRIHLDYTSSAPVLPEVTRAMVAALEECGNPSSLHQPGQRAKRLLEQARQQVAALINAKPSEISFTSCGTESNNWAVRGLFAANKRKGNSLDSPPHVLGGSLGTSPHGLSRVAAHLIISAIEHPSVSLAARRLEQDAGLQLSILPVDREGVISPASLRQAVTPRTVLVSVMLANGEVGTIEPIQELAAITHEHGALLHTDAIAVAGYVPLDVRALSVDALSLSANSFYGPQGAAALFVREGVRILPLLEGGGQETGARSGTEALPAIVGMGVAAEIAMQRLAERSTRLAVLRDQLRDGLNARIHGLRFNGSWSSRLPHHLHLCVDGVSSESLVLGLDHAGIAAGLGSACNSKSMRPSHVLKAMGFTDEQAHGALVLSVGESTTEAEIARALEIIPAVVQQLRRVTALTARGGREVGS